MIGATDGRRTGSTVLVNVTGVEMVATDVVGTVVDLDAERVGGRCAVVVGLARTAPRLMGIATEGNVAPFIDCCQLPESPPRSTAFTCPS